MNSNENDMQVEHFVKAKVENIKELMSQADLNSDLGVFMYVWLASNLLMFEAMLDSKSYGLTRFEFEKRFPKHETFWEYRSAFLQNASSELLTELIAQITVQLQDSPISTEHKDLIYAIIK